MAFSSVHVMVLMRGITSWRSGTFDWDIRSVALRNDWIALLDKTMLNWMSLTMSNSRSWTKSSHSSGCNLNHLRRVFATALCQSISTSLSRVLWSSSTCLTISATEFHRVGTEQTTCFNGTFCLVHNAFRSSWRTGEWKICFVSWVI